MLTIALILFSVLTSGFAGAMAADPPAGSPAIRLNQIGYAVGEQKLAFLLAPEDSAELIDESGQVAWRGQVGEARFWADAEDTGRMVDFSGFDRTGTWRIRAGSEISHPFDIAVSPWTDLLRGAIKALWYNRCSYAPEGIEAGLWARRAGHPDTLVRIHSSAVGPKRTTATRIRSPGGWYDAGDYGKYVVNAAISTWSLLHLYQTDSDRFDTLRIGVPEHRAVRSDLLDEALWNLRWMLTMQDPDDGGVYHRLSTATFPGNEVLPESDVAPRWVVQKSTAAALDLAATAAKAARLIDGKLPGLADSCRRAALSAWAWARKNPDRFFSQESLVENFFPRIEAGPYADRQLSDEFDWAATELMLTTGVDTFATAIQLSRRVGPSRMAGWIGWGDVRTLGLLSISLERGNVPSGGTDWATAADSMLVRCARDIAGDREANGFHLPKGGFWWSGNTTFANNGFLCWNAWRITGDTALRSAAIDMLDYLLGRNAIGYSFVTGFGSVTPQNPHHRISTGLAVGAPVPGLLVSGPNPGQEDQCFYESSLGPKSYVDDVESWSSNEPAINQNAALILLAGSLSLDRESSRLATPHRAARSAPQLLRTQVDGDLLSVTTPGERIERMSVLRPDGRMVAEVLGQGGTASCRLSARGVFVVRVHVAGAEDRESLVARP